MSMWSTASGDWGMTSMEADRQRAGDFHRHRATRESEYFNGYADGSYEAAHDDAPLTDEQLAECSEAYADGYRKGYGGDEPAEEQQR